MVAKQQKKAFARNTMYTRKHAHPFEYLSERTTFWVAVLSLFCFVTGNMLGTHGWTVFWASVLGNMDESVIAFDGFTAPLPGVPDYKKWSEVGGNPYEHTFRQLPADYLRPFPEYTGPESDSRIFLVDNLGTYKTGRGEGSHAGMDLAALMGTPVLSIGNGIVARVGNEPGGFGNFVVIKHPNVPDPDDESKTTTLYSAYAHLETVLVSESQVLRKGEQLGTAGKTGFAVGSHLHFSLEKADAPQHPYWNFTGAEARAAGLTTTQAVDAGLFRERGLQYTVHPLLYIQAHRIGRPTVAQASSSKSSVARALTAAERIAARKAERLARAPATSASQAVATVPASQSASASSAAPSVAVASQTIVAIATPPSTTVASIRISHDGAYTGERGDEETVTLVLLDAAGEVVTEPDFSRTVELRTAFGRATFQPASIAASDFHDGRIQVKMVPATDQKSAIVIQAQPFGSMSDPMKFKP